MNFRANFFVFVCEEYRSRNTPISMCNLPSAEHVRVRGAR